MAPSSVLVIGGCGFIGYHIVSHFAEAVEFSPISVISRSADSSVHKIEGTDYVAGDLGDFTSIQRALEQLRPQIIIHAATPSPITGTPKEYQKIVVDGTRELLHLAKKAPYVRALIFTSSSTIAKGREHLNLDEDFPIANTDRHASAYAKTKAAAELMVLAANTSLPQSLPDSDWSGYLRTSAIRLPICYGTHDTMTIPGCLQALQKGQTNVQIGDGKNMWDFCSTTNAARAHVLLARTLLSHSETQDTIGGEAFHIHDGQSRLFWDFAKAVWTAAGHAKQEKRTIALPVWLVSGLASILELMFWIFTFGRKRPQQLGKQQVEYACYTHTYSINKAKKRLGYEPVNNFDGELQKGVSWALQRDGWKRKLQDAGVLVKKDNNFELENK